MMTKAHYYLLQWDHSNTYFSLTECQKIINQLTSPTPISDYVMVHSDLKSKPESDSVAVTRFLKKMLIHCLNLYYFYSPRQFLF